MAFGPNFADQFGIPNLEYPFQGADTQGGLFGPNAPGQPLIGSQPLGPQSGAPASQAPASGVAPTTPPPTAANALASPLQLGQQPQPQPEQATAPIAGQGSPLGRPML